MLPTVDLGCRLHCANQGEMLTAPVLTTKRADYVPEDFTDMYAHYYDYCVRLVHKQGIDQQAAEDVAQAILVKFFEHNALADYDPEHTTLVNGEARPTMFRTFLSGFVLAYLRHYIERQAIHKRREGVSTDQPLGSRTAQDSRTVLDVMQPVYEEDFHDRLYEEELVGAIRSRLSSNVKRGATSRCDMPTFFESVLKQFNETGSIDALKLAAEFGISKTSVNNWLHKLRALVTEAVA